MTSVFQGLPCVGENPGNEAEFGCANDYYYHYYYYN